MHQVIHSIGTISRRVINILYLSTFLQRHFNDLSSEIKPLRQPSGPGGPREPPGDLRSGRIACERSLGPRAAGRGRGQRARSLGPRGTLAQGGRGLHSTHTPRLARRREAPPAPRSLTPAAPTPPSPRPATAAAAQGHLAAATAGGHNGGPRFIVQIFTDHSAVPAGAVLGGAGREGGRAALGTLHIWQACFTLVQSCFVPSWL